MDKSGACFCRIVCKLLNKARKGEGNIIAEEQQKKPKDNECVKTIFDGKGN
jgi:hypothetical protein